MNYIDAYHMKYNHGRVPVQTCPKCGRDFWVHRPADRMAHYPPNQFEVPVAFAQRCGGVLIPFQPQQ